MALDANGRRRTLVSGFDPIRKVDRQTESAQPEGAVVATDDGEVIQEWARLHAAEPATGEATESGGATVNVQDGGTGLRFNFPGAAMFRPISWEEWLAHLRRHDLLFVYERELPASALENRYRIVPRSSLRGTLDER